jgi:hypothetical protein
VRKIVAGSIVVLSLTLSTVIACGPEAGPAAETAQSEATTQDAVTGSWCVPDGGWDDTLSQTACCSGVAVQGSTWCFNPADYGTTWKTCVQVCGSKLVNGCVPSGGIDDVLGLTTCCSGAAVPGSTHCLNPADYGTTWKSCVHTCQ